MLIGALAMDGAATTLETIRVFATEPACFEYLFTGAVNGADGQLLLSFNHRSGRTFFVKPGGSLGRYQVTAYESKTNHIYHPSVNAWLDEPAGKVTLTAPRSAAVILEQDRRLPQPGRVAWLVRLDNGSWWNIQEMDVFFMDKQIVAVEEIAEDGVTVTAGQDLQLIPPITAEEKHELTSLWAERKRQEQQAQELAVQRRREAAKTTESESSISTFTVPRGTRAETRGPSQFFYGNEFRYPTAFKVSPGIRYVNGQVIQSPIVVPSRFETGFSGISVTVP